MKKKITKDRSVSAAEYLALTKLAKEMNKARKAARRILRGCLSEEGLFFNELVAAVTVQQEGIGEIVAMRNARLRKEAKAAKAVTK